MRMMGLELPSSKRKTEEADKATVGTSVSVFDEPANMERPAPVPGTKPGQTGEPSSTEEEQPPTGTTPQRRVSGKQRRLSLEEYRNTFMRPYRIEDRKPVFISRKLRDTLDRFACKIGENRMSLSGLLENIVRHHVELYAEDFERWKGM